MNLKRRLDKLEPVAVEHWRGKWSKFLDHTDAHIPAEAADMIAKAQAPEPKTPDPQREAQELTEALEGVALHGLDLLSLCRWFDAWTLPDAERAVLTFTPDSIPTPPDEPCGVWDALTGQLGAEGDRGDAAAIVLYMLGMARAVRVN